ncbi:MAG: hypothetical protein ABWY53_02950 [Leifsonia flava]
MLDPLQIWEHIAQNFVITSTARRPSPIQRDRVAKALRSRLDAKERSDEDFFKRTRQAFLDVAHSTMKGE